MSKAALRHPRRRTMVALLAVFTLALVPPVFGAVHTVTSFQDNGGIGQLRTLMNAAALGDTIVIPPGTIVLTGPAGESANVSGDLDVTKDLTIVGAGAELTIIDGNANDRVFQVASGVSATISGLTMRNGSIDPAAPFEPSGGGLLNRGTLTLADVIVEANFAGGGGGLANFGGSLTISGSTVRNNTSAGITANGGGISNFAMLTIDSSTISGNTILGPSASSLGGGVINSDTMTITNSTISDNTAAGNFGGGIYQVPGAISTRLVNVTVAFNRTTLSGGGIATVGGVFEMVNTILSNNSVSPGGNGRDCSGIVTSLGHNLIHRTDACTISGTTSGNLLGRPARIRRLADNGGPTETNRLRNSSRAIDAGDNALCPGQDQRGVPRVTTCDIGAYEQR